MPLTETNNSIVSCHLQLLHLWYHIQELRVRVAEIVRHLADMVYDKLRRLEARVRTTERSCTMRAQAEVRYHARIMQLEQDVTFLHLQLTQGNGRHHQYEGNSSLGAQLSSSEASDSSSNFCLQSFFTEEELL